jgi:hexosaminidase
MRKNITFLLLIVFSTLCFSSCSKQLLNERSESAVMERRVSATNLGLIPQPVSMKISDGSLLLKRDLAITINGGRESIQIARYLRDYLNNRFGYESTVWIERADNPNYQIALNIDENLNLPNDEGYILAIDESGISIEALSTKGLFYGVQTLFQILPDQQAGKDLIEVQTMLIQDYPRYEWRGMHLDVCRHFFDVDFIKKYIDILAMHKMNTFHWHLTEDQGWRIEIKKYPKLTEIGAWRTEEDGSVYGGFYTQEEVREVVKYAAEKYITVVPEIELPGHSVAALAAYPEYSCTGGPFEVANNWGVFTDVYCAGKEETFEFLTDIIGEVIDLFPSEYFHIGGDECPKKAWEECLDCQERIADQGLKNEHGLQSYFVKRIEKFLISKNRKLIGWDEILEGGLAPQAAVMSWRGYAGGIAAAEQGHDVVMSPTGHCYFDYAQAKTGEPKSFNSYLPLNRVYTFDPTPPDMDAEQAKHILGGQGNVWTEYIPTSDHVEYMLAPRICAMAEVLWSPKQSLNFKGFEERLGYFYRSLDANGVNYRIPTPTMYDSYNVTLKSRYEINLAVDIPGAVVRYTIDGSDPDQNSTVYSEPFKLKLKDASVSLKSRIYMSNGRASRVAEMVFEKQELRKAQKISNLIPGVAYDYYEGEIQTVEDFSKAEKLESGILEFITLPENRNESLIGLEINGYINIPLNGVYTFTTISDDGSALWINDEMVVNNDGFHSMQEIKGQIALKKGYHSIKIRFFEGWGGEGLKLNWQSEDIDYQEVPASVLFYVE